MNKEDAEKALLSNNDYDKEVVPFVSELIDGTISNLKEIDEYLVKIAENWELDRMASIDKAILRLASYELLVTPATPPNVVINEAIELAKEFSTENSGKFVNGILDKIKNLRDKKTVG